MSDYNTAPTDPHHGGKLMLHQMPARIEELEAQLAEQVAWVQDLATELQTAEAQFAAMMDSLQDVTTDFNDAHREKLELEAMLPRAYRAGVEAVLSESCWADIAVNTTIEVVPIGAIRAIPIPTSAEIILMCAEKKETE